MYNNFHTDWTKISGSLEPRTSKILGNLPVKSVFGARARTHVGTHVRALVCNELTFMLLTICKNFNPLPFGVRAAGDHKKSYKASFPMNSPNWELMANLARFWSPSFLIKF